MQTTSFASVRETSWQGRPSVEEGSSPVHRSGKAIDSPDAMDINTAKQRCRVKAMGEFGLGYTMWLSSQIREQSVSNNEQTTEPETNDADDELNKVIAIWDHLKFYEANRHGCETSSRVSQSLLLPM